MIIKSSSNDDKYLQVIYDEKLLPYTNYPELLTKHLFETYDLKEGQKILDIGCGRGEFLSGFIKKGLVGTGVDKNIDIAKKVSPKASLKSTDLEKNGLPLADNSFDVIFSKSVIEHLYYPDKLMHEVKRVLKPGGLVITMCPSWEYNYKIYFEDYTHRTPFMKKSLHDLLSIHSFEEIKVDFFIQLPILWKKWTFFLLPLVFLTRIMVPRKLSKKFKWVRFSKEIMLISIAKKSKR
jgi:SAM-dependent methyltransferase